jgi:outer membrane protein OmpA-like peptidoglycan-associated protein
MSASFLAAVCERAAATASSQRADQSLGTSCLMQETLLSDDDLWFELVHPASHPMHMGLADVARLCATCSQAHSRAAATANSYAREKILYREPSESRYGESRLYPKEGSPWSIELIHLCLVELPLAFMSRFFQTHDRHKGRDFTEGWLIPFEFASDDVESSASNTRAESTLDAIATILRRHPGLRLRIEGNARPGAPAIFGQPLSQARAVRVRQELLHRLADAPAWHSEGEASEGVRPGGYTENGGDFDDVASFYTQRDVGRRLQARGVWADEDQYAERLSAQGSPGGQSAHVELVGFS